MASVHVLRHGESTANVEGVIVSRPGPRALEEVGLTGRGREQVRESARQSGLGPDTHILTSDFARAAQTAAILAETVGAAEPVVDIRLRERGFGEHEETSAAAYEGIWSADALGEHPGEDVETVEEVAARAGAVLADVRPLEVPVVLVAHGDVLQILLATAAGRPAREHRRMAPLGNAELREV